jgi:hypothetical protein
MRYLRFGRGGFAGLAGRMGIGERGGAFFAAVDALVNHTHIRASGKLSAFHTIALRIPTMAGVGERHVSYICFNRHRIGLRSSAASRNLTLLDSARDGRNPLLNVPDLRAASDAYPFGWPLNPSLGRNPSDTTAPPVALMDERIPAEPGPAGQARRRRPV